MKEIINNQIAKLLSDIELITDPYQRAQARIGLINSCLPEDIETKTEGKEAIKKDKKKEPKKEEPKEVQLEPTFIVEVDGENIDLTSICNLLSNFKGTDDEKLELAYSIKENSLEPIYESINEILDLDDCEDKMKLAYYLQSFGVDELNGFVHQLTDGQFDQLESFVNNENLNGLITNIENAANSEE